MAAPDKRLPFIVKDGFLYEGNASDRGVSLPSACGTAALENPELDTNWYARYFFHNGQPLEHQNYVTKEADPEFGPLTVSVIRESQGETANYRVIVRTRKANDKMVIPVEKRKQMNLESLLKMVKPIYGRLARKLVPVTNPAIYKDLLAIEDMDAINRYKFGVLLCLKDQTDEKDMFSNEHSTPAFSAFLDCIADKIELLGWSKYKAGLDTKFGNTGSHSYYTTCHGVEIMFHVTTCLPYTKNDRQQLQRKRQCGNDVVQIIFVEDNETPFDPECIASHFNHVWVVVQPSGHGKSYRVSVARKDSVPAFGPLMPEPAVFASGEEFRTFFLTKLINGERASMNSETFVNLSERTKDVMLTDLVTTFSTNTRGDKEKEEKILKQLEADMAKNPIAQRKRVVDVAATATVMRSIQEDIIAMDSWGENRLVWGTETGLWAAELGTGIDELKTVYLVAGDRFNYIKVLEKEGVIFVSAGKKGKEEPRTYDISAVEARFANPLTSIPATATRVLGDMKKISVGASHPINPLVAVAAAKVVQVFRWENRQMAMVAEQTMPADVTSLEFFGNFLVVGFRSEFNLIDLETSNVTVLHRHADKLPAGCLLRVDDDLLVMFDRYAMFVDVAGNVRGEVMEWNSVPTGIAYLPPYLIAVSGQHIEVRTRLTGRLVQHFEYEKLSMYNTKAGVFLGAKQSATHNGFMRLTLVPSAGFAKEVTMLDQASVSIGAAMASLDGAPPLYNNPGYEMPVAQRAFLDAFEAAIAVADEASFNVRPETAPGL